MLPRPYVQVTVVFPFGAFVPWVDPITTLMFYILTTPLMLYIAVRTADRAPLTSFLLATRAFSDSVPVVGLVVRDGRATLGLVPANTASYVLVNAKYPSVVATTLFFSFLFVLFSEALIVYLVVFRGRGMPTALKVMLYPTYALALTTVIVIHEMGHVLMGAVAGLRWVGGGFVFPVSAFVMLEGEITPEAGVLVAAGGNLMVSIYLIISKHLRKSDFVRMTRAIGAQLTLMNAVPAIGFTAPDFAPYIYPTLDGSRVLIFGLMSPVAFVLAVAVTYFCLKASVQALREESFTIVKYYNVL